MNTSYFVSDVHFRSKDGMPEKMFLAFLGEIEGQADSLFLVGDIFDFWVGHRRLAQTTSHSSTLSNALSKRGSSTLLYKHTLRRPWHSLRWAPRFIRRVKVYALAGIDVVEHGDLIDPSSQLRRTICSLARSKLIHRIARLVPLD